MYRLKFFLLGPPRIEFQGEPIDLNLRKAVALLVYLAVTGKPHSRDELATLLWPESNQRNARASLRRTLYTINKTFGEEILPTGSDMVHFDPKLVIWTDVEGFQGSVKEFIESDQVRGDFITGRHLASLEEAVALYAGDYLSGFTLPDSPGFDEWQFFEAEGLRGSLGAALRKLVSAYESREGYHNAIQYARRWLSLDNLNEAVHRRLIELYAKSGRQNAALRQYNECVRILKDELDVAPEPATTQLYQDIRLHRGVDPSPPVVGQPEVKYVASGDVHIAYRTMGEGPVDIVFVSGFITHMEQTFEDAAISAFFRALASFSRVIIFDRRGVGLSDRVGYPPTLEDTLDDMLAVMQAVGTKKAVLMGYIEGGPNSILFAATYPKLVSGLVLYATSAKWARSDDYPWALTRDQYDLWFAKIMANWGEPLDLDIYAPSRVHDSAFRAWWAKSMRLSSSPGGIKAVLEVMREIDVRDILPAIRTPTLILHRKGDRVVRVGAGRYLAGVIPGARYVELEGDDHWFFLGDTQSIIDEIRVFVQNLESPPVPERMLATIMMMEWMGGTEMGGSGFSGQAEVRSDDFLMSQEVNRFRGSEVSRVNGLYTAIFDGPSRAIQCAKTIMSAAHREGIRLRAGLHAGECEFLAGELVGTAVQIAEGILGAATPNEILVSSTVKDLVVGSGFEFVQRGQCEVSGISGQWGIFCLV
jgi:DNA-binding SARP family transcriptional activator/pimeloyl-ACP methyl ester carboxylesterase